ncbi:MAG TPA: wax ester/triacylglycerol synthase domain-containing protein, partial [Thermoleophilaceae bacterium]|nr:wax ester/triacylglycerol synthase domain-containing protein [Thermoleophilaceae bacterium]
MAISGAEALSDEDARILALEQGPVRGHTCKVAIVDGRIDMTGLRERVDRRLGRERLLSLRLADGDPPCWEPDPAFDVARHVRDAGAVAEDDLHELVGRLMAERLPRDRPLWALDAVRVGGRRSALVWRIHHAL